MTVRRVQSTHAYAPKITMLRVDPGTCKAWDELTDNEKLAWQLRAMADKLDGGISFSYKFNTPDDITVADIWDAMCMGVISTQEYLGDIIRDNRET